MQCSNFSISRLLISIWVIELLCMCVCVRFASSMEGDRAWTLSSATDFTAWMSVLPSNLMDEISSNTEVFSANT